MTDWEKFEPYITPFEVREQLSNAKHENNNVKNTEDDWLKAGRRIDASNANQSSSYFSELEKRLKK